MSIRKVYAEVHSILETNQDKKVSEVLELLLPLMESKQRTSNQRINDKGQLEIFCYYHKEWECVNDVEYGTKANSATGYNTMCKVGVNQWTKQQREFKKAKANLLDLVANGELEASELTNEITKLEEARDIVVPR